MWYQMRAAHEIASTNPKYGQGDPNDHRDRDAFKMLVDPTSDHYSDHIDGTRQSKPHRVSWEFDATALASSIAHARQRLGLSTRDLSRLAGISQPYVVALERARSSRLRKGPTPTVEVMARLSFALDCEPEELFAAALRRTGRHVLLVVEDAERSPLQHALQATDAGPDTWVLAGSSTTTRGADGADHRSIALHRGSPTSYEPATIAASLRDELQRLGPDLDACSVGLVFAETSRVMSALDDPMVVIDFEREWGDIVTEAAAAVGAHAAWNVCVYEIGALKALHDPVGAALELLRSHDTLWAARRSEVATGASAARRILGRLRPASVTRAAWRTTSEHLIEGLELVA